MCAERITKVIVSGMEAYIPHSLNLNLPKLGLTHSVLVLYSYMIDIIERLPTKGT